VYTDGNYAYYERFSPPDYFQTQGQYEKRREKRQHKCKIPVYIGYAAFVVVFKQQKNKNEG
jgi:hypothetical protein